MRLWRKQRDFREVRTMRTVCLVVVALALAPVLTTAAEQTEGTIRAVGKAAVWAVPDVACCTLWVTVQHDEQGTARSLARQKMQDLQQAVKALGLEGLKVRPELYLRTEYKPPSTSPQGAPTPEGDGRARWEGACEANVWLSGFEQPEALHEAVQRVIEVAKQNGATAWESFTLDAGPVWREALEKATKAAMADAEAMARGLGVTIRGYRYVGVLPERVSSELPEAEKPTPPPAGRSWYREPKVTHRVVPEAGADTSWPLAVEATVYVTAVY